MAQYIITLEDHQLSELWEEVIEKQSSLDNDLKTDMDRETYKDNRRLYRIFRSIDKAFCDQVEHE